MKLSELKGDKAFETVAKVLTAYSHIALSEKDTGRTELPFYERIASIMENNANDMRSIYEALEYPAETGSDLIKSIKLFFQDKDLMELFGYQGKTKA